MNKTWRPWYESPPIVLLITLLTFILLAFLIPILTIENYYFLNGHIDRAVVEIDNPTEYSREEIVEASEIAKDAFYEEFPFSNLDELTYIDSSRYREINRIVFRADFRPTFMEDLVSTQQADGTAVMWFTLEKTEQGKWKYIGISSDW